MPQVGGTCAVHFVTCHQPHRRHNIHSIPNSPRALYCNGTGTSTSVPRVTTTSKSPSCGWPRSWPAKTTSPLSKCLPSRHPPSRYAIRWCKTGLSLHHGSSGFSSGFSINRMPLSSCALRVNMLLIPRFGRLIHEQMDPQQAAMAAAELAAAQQAPLPDDDDDDL